jgi:hypothetical protein
MNRNNPDLKAFTIQISDKIHKVILALKHKPISLDGLLQG